MQKKYIAPQTEVTEFTSQSIICTSAGGELPVYTLSDTYDQW